MKKTLYLLFALAAAMSLAACGPAKASETNNAPNQGIIVNTIEFERVSFNDLSPGVQSRVDQEKKESGYDIIDFGEDIYLVVYAGEKPSPGYGIVIDSIVDNEGKTLVTVKNLRPAKGDVSALALTYPFDIVKLSSGISGNVTLEFVDVK